MNGTCPSAPNCQNATALSRRGFLRQATAVSLVPWLAHAAAARPRILDTHVHFYDPTRPQGIPWPKPDDRVLYRRVLPADYVAALGGAKVDGVIVVEASGWLEDNQWLLDLASREPLIAGVIGHLEPEAPEFARQVKRFAANPVFRGIRIGGGSVGKKLDDAVFMAAMRTLADQGLTLDVIGGASMLAPVAKLAAQFPGLPIVLNHLAAPGDPAKGIPENWLAGMRTAGAQKNVFCKMSGLVELVKKDEPGRSPTSLDTYRKILDVTWDAMGPERLVYGSNWPVCERGAPLPAVQALALEYLALKGREATERVCWSNARTAYRLTAQ